MHIWMGDRDGGGLVDPAEAKVSVLDHGFTVADGVFETMKVVPQGVVALTRHLRRLKESAAVLGLPEPRADVVRDAIADVVEVAASDMGPMGRLRVTYTAGAAPLGSERGDHPPTLVIVLAPANPWPATTRAITVPWPRNEMSPTVGAKTTSYAENVVALQKAHEQGAAEAIFANTRGKLCEGTGSNVFVVLDGQVLTPPLSSGCLGGITRELVLEFVGGREIDLDMKVLREADEVFITSSTRDVHPVSALDDRIWATVGEVTLDFQRRFAQLIAEYVDR